jgi:hypothetical protein
MSESNLARLQRLTVQHDTWLDWGPVLERTSRDGLPVTMIRPGHHVEVDTPWGEYQVRGEGSHDDIAAKVCDVIEAAAAAHGG